MLISIAICTFERYDALAACLASLGRQGVATAEREVLVLDNSPDAARSQHMAAALGGLAGLRWIHLDRRGLAHARNHAVQQARAPLVAFLDDDVTVAPGWLAAVLEGFARFGEAAHSLGGPVRPDWRAPPPPWLAEGMLPFLSLIDRGPDSRLLETDEWVPSANAAFRRERLLAAGGFREDLGRRGTEAMLLSGEDTELVERLHRAGGRTAWQPAAEAFHRIDPSRLDQAWFRRRFAWQAISDFMVQPDAHLAAGAASWQEAQRYVSYINTPGLGALAATQTQPDLCHWQMSAIYHLVLSLLGGLSGVSPPATEPQATQPPAHG
jgi:GT2 family glycosyltransferase